MSVEIEITGAKEFADRMEQVNEFMQRQVRLKLQRLGEDIHAAAHKMCPVRTGRLRASIYSKVEDWTLKVGATAPYAKFVEFGTRHMRPFYFLTEAIHLHLPRLHRILTQAIEWAIKEASWKG